jgi:hypothetical protein
MMRGGAQQCVLASLRGLAAQLQDAFVEPAER